MKQLQNNFTTTEQSTRLLELGVPADSADCYIRLDFNITESPDIIRYGATFSEIKKRNEIIDKNFIPCWSVGRLIEIIEICSEWTYQDFRTSEGHTLTLMQRVIITIEQVIKNKWQLDFSKLED